MRFPLFIDLKGKKALVVGGGRVGAARAKILTEFGADVTLVAEEICDKSVLENVRLLNRKFDEKDLDGVFLAVAATDDREVNRRIAEICGENGIFVSVADSSDEGTFYFPALCIKNGLCAGIVSDGTRHKAVKEAAERVRGVL